jgi:hypothetical protein
MLGERYRLVALRSNQVHEVRSETCMVDIGSIAIVLLLAGHDVHASVQLTIVPRSAVTGPSATFDLC